MFDKTDKTTENTTEPKSYPVGTVEDMARIPLEARGRFLAELPRLLDIVAMGLMLNDALAAASDGKAGCGMIEAPVWIDDGADNVTIETTLKTGEPGETA